MASLTKLRYKDPTLRSRQFVTIKGRDACNNFSYEKLAVVRSRAWIGRKQLKLVDRIVVEAR
jgi:hypothetical protein